MSRRVTSTAFVLAALLALAGLVAGAATDRRATAFAPGVPNNSIIAMLRPGQQLCQGPVALPAAADHVLAWASPDKPLGVQVRRADDRRELSSPRLLRPASPTGQLTIPVRVPTGARVTVCFRNEGAGSVDFEGGPPTPSSGDFTLNGQRTTDAVALLFLRSRPPSLISLLPQVFRRAGLFKLGGVGAWLFWLLGAALLGGLVLAGIAVTEAARADAAAQDP